MVCHYATHTFSPSACLKGMLLKPPALQHCHSIDTTFPPLRQPTSTISWCDQLPTSSTSSLSLETRAAAAAAAAVIADMEEDVRPYACDLCTCAYKHASSLLNHKLTHRTGDFRCVGRESMTVCDL